MVVVNCQVCGKPVDSKEPIKDTVLYLCPACRESVARAFDVKLGLLSKWLDEQLKTMRNTADQNTREHVIECMILNECRLAMMQTAIALTHVALPAQVADLIRCERVVAAVPDELDWAFWAAILGQPLDSLRTLRFAFELLVQTYVLERKYPLMKDEEKFEAQHEDMLAKDEVHRSFYLELIDGMGGFDENGRREGFDEDERRTLKYIYGKLSEYTHPSYEQFINPPDLGLVSGLVFRLVDLMMAVAVDLFPSIVGEISKEFPRSFPLQLWSMSSKRIRLALGSIPSQASTPEWDIRYVPSGISRAPR